MQNERNTAPYIIVEFGLVFFKYSVTYWIIFFMALYGYGVSDRNARMDATAIQVMSKVQAKFTPYYIDSAEYWDERHDYYEAYCPYQGVSYFCRESDRISHHDYIDDRYYGINARYARVKDGDNGGIARFFKLL